MQITKVNLTWAGDELVGAKVDYTAKIDVDGFYETASGQATLTATEFDGKKTSELASLIQQKREAAMNGNPI